MGLRSKFHPLYFVYCILISLLGVSCNPTKHLNEGEYLLRKNNITLKTDKGITRRGELKDNIERLIVQKPNRYVLGLFPYKVWLYNARYEKFKNDSVNKSVEKPVVYDSMLVKRSSQNTKS